MISILKDHNVGKDKNVNINFVHANGFPSGSYKKLFSLLSQEIQVFAKDKYAHDHRFPLVDHWHHQVDELIEFVELKQQDPTNATRPTYAVGHSFGAVLSYLASCKRPDLFKGLVMLDPPLITGLAGFVFQTAKRTSYIDKITPAGLTKFRRRTWHIEDDLVAYFKQKALFKDIQEECIKDYVESVMTEQKNKFVLDFDVDIEANIFRTLPTNLKRHYGQLKIPSLLITGKDTKVCVPKLYKSFLKGNPSVEHRVLSKGGHMYPLEYPELLAKELNQFIV